MAIESNYAAANGEEVEGDADRLRPGLDMQEVAFSDDYSYVAGISAKAAKIANDRAHEHNIEVAWAVCNCAPRAAVNGRLHLGGAPSMVGRQHGVVARQIDSGDLAIDEMHEPPAVASGASKPRFAEWHADVGSDPQRGSAHRTNSPGMRSCVERRSGHGSLVMSCATSDPVTDMASPRTSVR